MRLIATFQTEKDANRFHALLESKSIKHQYEVNVDSSSQAMTYCIWAINEEDLAVAQGLYDEFLQNPSAFLHEPQVPPTILRSNEPTIPKRPPSRMGVKIRLSPHLMRMHIRTPITRWVIFICALLFTINGYQKYKLAEESPALAHFAGVTPLSLQLMFDVPSEVPVILEFFKKYPNTTNENIESLPPEGKALFGRLNNSGSWQGLVFVAEHWPESKPMLQAPMFVKIREGQLWRLWTPVLLHRDILHILFNMLWIWLLGRQVEQKIGKIRYLLMMLVIACISNTAQYMMGGPFFIGYSGVICGLGGFIWVRLKEAPWEGYAIQRETLIFLGVFVVGMMILQMVSFILQYFQLASFQLNIGNTSHITGLLIGMLLAKIPYFYRLPS